MTNSDNSKRELSFPFGPIVTIAGVAGALLYGLLNVSHFVEIYMLAKGYGLRDAALSVVAGTSPNTVNVTIATIGVAVGACVVALSLGNASRRVAMLFISCAMFFAALIVYGFAAGPPGLHWCFWTAAGCGVGWWLGRTGALKLQGLDVATRIVLGEQLAVDESVGAKDAAIAGVMMLLVAVLAAVSVTVGLTWIGSLAEPREWILNGDAEVEVVRADERVLLCVGGDGGLRAVMRSAVQEMTPVLDVAH